VVGADQAQMQAQGFRPVGKDFPVFLHPRSAEEYALARTERKSGRGYRGFVVDADPSVTLEEDLLRRDFTINAIARDENTGELFDPYNGARDLQARVLRHVGPAFVEDPVRVLRAARFMARLAPLGFTLAPDTASLMRQMAVSGELDSLVPERVWQELQRALTYAQPSAFLRTLHQTDALRVILPEIDALYGIPQRAEFHPEVDTGIHQEMVSDMIAHLAPGDALVGFAALCHDLGKALTPPEEWPRHVMHEQRGVTSLQSLCERLKVPHEYRQLAMLACREHLNVHRLPELRDRSVHALLVRCDAFRRPERIAQLALVCEADKRGRLGSEQEAYPQGEALKLLHAAALAINARDLAVEGMQGPQIGQALTNARVAAIAAVRNTRA